MKILHVIPSMAARTGGPAVSTLSLCRSVSRLGITSTIFTTDIATAYNATEKKWSTAPEVLPSGAQEVDIRFFRTRTPRTWCYSPDMSASLNHEVASFDLVHIHGLYLYPQFAAFRACRSAGVPYLVSPHGALDPFLRSRNRGRKLVTDRLWQQRMLDSAAFIHATSAREADLVRAAGIKAQVRSGPYGINLSAFLRARDARRELQSREGGILLLNHGRLDPKKGLDTAIQAMPKVIDQFPNARLELVGPDDTGLATELTRLARQLGVAQAVTLVGSLGGQELAERVSAADVWVLPSKGENFGIAVGEAMAAGVPVIATDVVDLAATAAQANAAIIADDTSDAFADAIINLLSDPAQTSAIADRGNAFVRQYDWDDVGLQFYDLYATIVRGDHSARVSRNPDV